MVSQLQMEKRKLEEEGEGKQEFWLNTNCTVSVDGDSLTF